MADIEYNPLRNPDPFMNGHQAFAMQKLYGPMILNTSENSARRPYRSYKINDRGTRRRNRLVVSANRMNMGYVTPSGLDIPTYIKARQDPLFAEALKAKQTDIDERDTEGEEDDTDDENK